MTQKILSYFLYPDNNDEAEQIRQGEKLPSCFSQNSLLVSHPKHCHLALHSTPWTDFAYCEYLLSFVTKTNHFPVHSGPIQLSRPRYVPISIKEPRFFMLGWLDWIPEEMLLYFHWKEGLDAGPKLLLWTGCDSCIHWFWKGHGKIIFKDNFINYCYFLREIICDFFLFPLYLMPL